MGLKTLTSTTQQINKVDAELVKAIGFYNLFVCISIALLLISPLVAVSVWLSKAKLAWAEFSMFLILFCAAFAIAAYRAHALLERFYSIVAELEAVGYSVYRPAGLHKSIRISESPAPASAFVVYNSRAPLLLGSYFHSFNGRGYSRMEI